MSSPSDIAPLSLPVAFLNLQADSQLDLLAEAEARLSSLRLQFLCLLIAEAFEAHPSLTHVMFIAEEDYDDYFSVHFLCNREINTQYPHLNPFETDPDVGSSPNPDPVLKALSDLVGDNTDRESWRDLHQISFERPVSGSILERILEQALRPVEFALWQACALEASAWAASSPRSKPASL